MSLTKRQKTGSTEKSSNSSTITQFEQLPNEVILRCFGYLSVYHLYQSFSCINARLNELIIDQTNNGLNLSSIPDEVMLTFCFQLHRFLTITNNYPLSIISISDEQKFNFIMKDNLFQDKFSKLKSLTLSGIHAEHIYNVIFNETTQLYHTLERVTLDEVSDGHQYSSYVDRKKGFHINENVNSLYLA